MFLYGQMDASLLIRFWQQLWFNRFGSFAMTVVRPLMSSSMCWLRSAQTASPTTLAWPGAEQVAVLLAMMVTVMVTVTVMGTLCLMCMGSGFN